MDDLVKICASLAAFKGCPASENRALVILPAT